MRHKNIILLCGDDPDLAEPMAAILGTRHAVVPDGPAVARAARGLPPARLRHIRERGWLPGTAHVEGTV